MYHDMYKTWSKHPSMQNQAMSSLVKILSPDGFVHCLKPAVLASTGKLQFFNSSVLTVILKTAFSNAYLSLILRIIAIEIDMDLLVPLGNQPSSYPILTQTCDVIWYYYAMTIQVLKSKSSDNKYGRHQWFIWRFHHRNDSCLFNILHLQRSFIQCWWNRNTWWKWKISEVHWNIQCKNTNKNFRYVLE